MSDVVKHQFHFVAHYIYCLPPYIPFDEYFQKSPFLPFFTDGLTWELIKYKVNIVRSNQPYDHQLIIKTLFESLFYSSLLAPQIHACTHKLTRAITPPPPPP